MNSGAYAKHPTEKPNHILKSVLFRSFKSDGDFGQDTFTLMMLCDSKRTACILATFGYCIQMILGFLVLMNLVSQSNLGGQVFTTIINLAFQKKYPLVHTMYQCIVITVSDIELSM